MKTKRGYIAGKQDRGQEAGAGGADRAALATALQSNIWQPGGLDLGCRSIVTSVCMLLSLDSATYPAGTGLARHTVQAPPARIMLQPRMADDAAAGSAPRGTETRHAAMAREPPAIWANV